MNSTINFLYFLHNNNGIVSALTDCFGGNLGSHFVSKLQGFIGNSPVCTADHIIKLMMEMSDNHKEQFLIWIDSNYSYKR